ncbi:MAG: hypothetical protein U0263_29730 [Polyangiaceae bacterium]
MRRVLACAILLFASARCGPPGGAPYPAERASEPAHAAGAIDGEVLGVDRVPPRDKLASGVQLKLRPSERGAVVIDLAPDWYLDRHGLHFAPSERVHVETSPERSPGGVLYATRIRKGEKTVELRDPETGAPLWTPKDAK